MKICLRSIKILFKKFPFCIIYYIFNIALPIVTTLLSINVMKTIVQMYEDNKELKEIVIYILVYFSIMFVLDAITIVLQLYRNRLDRLFPIQLSKDFYNKTYEIDYKYFDNPKFLNTFNRSLTFGVDHIYTIATNSIEAVGVVISSVAILTVIATISWYVIVVDIIIGFIYLLFKIRIGYINKEKNDLQRPYMRFSWYASRTFSIRDGMEDIKTSDIDKVLISRNEESLDKSIKISKKYGIKSAIWDFFGNIFLSLLYPITIATIIYFTTDLSEKIPDFVALTVAATALSRLITNFSNKIGSIETILQDTKIPFEMLDIVGEIEDGKSSNENVDFKTLTIKDLDFSYKGDKNQLENINITINKGDHIAIVGANGSGKTTLVRMLLRLYDPNSGNIELNGKDYKEFSPSVIRNTIGAVFQNVEVYAASVAENVLLRKVKTPEDIDIVNESLKFSGLYDYVSTLDQGINTELIREFKVGSVLSHGQNQRLAIARGYAQNYQLFILDEPSSALDPIAEAQVYKNMFEMTKDKTVIFISHRLTSAVKASKIYLFDDGKVIEEGTHEELIANKGLYYKMFVSQSHKYLGEEYEK